MKELVEFLLARIAEYEVVAQSVQEVTEKLSSDVFTSIGHQTGTVEMSPRLVLAECEAKRRVIQGDPCAACLVEGTFCDQYWLALTALAHPYQDHPDFRPEWSMK